nr:MAG TPA: Regulatory protein-modification, helix-turn-helix, transcriptional regulator, DNA [Caudoviricetes sp.]
MAKKAPNKRSRLETELFANRYTEADVAAVIGRSTSYVSNRMIGRYAWTVAEAYQILKLLRKEPRDFVIYFPPEEGYACEKVMFCVG